MAPLGYKNKHSDFSEKPNQMKHPSHTLYEMVKRFDYYPSGVVPIPWQLQGSSFFPGGIGLISEAEGKHLPEFPYGGVMVVGHDWGTVGDFDTYSKSDAENLRNPTWRNMLPFLRKADIDPKICFFTNFFVGLRTSSSSVGVFPGVNDSAYVSACLALLTEQIEIQRPKLIVVLGKHAPKLIAKASHQLRCWSNFSSFKAMDQNNAAVILGANLLNSTHKFSSVCLVHPCHRQLNVQHRYWNGFSGDEAEINLTKYALMQAV